MNRICRTGIVSVLFLLMTRLTGFSALEIRETSFFDRAVLITDHLFIHEDSAKLKTLNDLMTNPGLFLPHSDYTPQNPYSIYWLKFELTNQTDEHLHFSLIFKNLTYVDLFELHDDSLIQSHNAGLFRKKSEISPGDEPGKITLILDPGDLVTAFIRVEHIKGYKPKFGFYLQNEVSYLADSRKSERIDFIIFGGFLIFCLYSLIIFFFSRISSYLWLSMFAFGSAFYGFSIAGNIVVFLSEIPETAWRLNPVFSNLSGIGGFLLMNSFLDLKKNSLLLSRVIYVLIAYIIAQILVSQGILFTNQNYRLMTNVNLFSLFLYFPIIVCVPALVWNKLVKHQKVMSVIAFIYGFTLLAAFFIFWFRKEDALIDIFWISNLILLLVIIFFTVSLGEQMRTIEIERNLVLIQLSKIKDEQNQMLEELVDQRTRLLSDANEELEIQKEILTKRNERIELLLKELHHRVKNNLQLFSSIYELSALHRKEKDIHKIVAEGQARIKVMALVHNMLYQGNQESLIDMVSYLSQISEYLKNIVKTHKKVEVTVTGQGLFFDLDTALPLGLIVNELLTNTLKHCQTNDKTIQINLTITYIENGKYILVFTDNGIPLPEKVDISSQESFGLRMITILSKQLNGDFRYSYEQKNRFVVHFMDSESRKKIL